jgi:hypothetical protein
MSIAGCTSPAVKMFRSNPALNTRWLPAMTTAPTSSRSALSSASLRACCMVGPSALTFPSSIVITAMDSSRR